MTKHSQASQELSPTNQAVRFLPPTTLPYPAGGNAARPRFGRVRPRRREQEFRLYGGHEISRAAVEFDSPNSESVTDCIDRCMKEDACRAWTFVRPKPGHSSYCRLIATVPQPEHNTCCVSGIRGAAVGSEESKVCELDEALMKGNSNGCHSYWEVPEGKADKIRIVHIVNDERVLGGSSGEARELAGQLLQRVHGRRARAVGALRPDEEPTVRTSTRATLCGSLTTPALAEPKSHSVTATALAMRLSPKY